jgi:predicted kinase
MPERPLLVIITGPPAAGKTTVAALIADELRLALLEMDNVKETLFEHLGASNREESEQLGRAAFAVEVEIARGLLGRGVSLVLEAAVNAAEAEPLAALLSQGRATAVHLAVSAEPAIRLSRHQERVRIGDRHRAHWITDEAEALEWAERGVPEHVVPDLPCRLIEIDASEASLAADRVLDAVRNALGLPPS